MIDKEVIYNSEYLVIVPSTLRHLAKAFEYTYGNVLVFDDLENVEKQIKIISKSNYNQVILVDYIPEYKSIISILKNRCILKVIFTKALGTLYDSLTYNNFNEVIKLYNQKIIKKVGFIDSNLYNAFKNKIDCCNVSLDIEKKEYSNKFNSNRVGLLNESCNPTYSYYNELSALSFNKYKASLKTINKTTKDFLKLFKIKYKTNKKKYIDNNLVNLYVNFTNNNNVLFLESMDRNVPCILGNNEILDNSELKKYLVLNSDDDINEIKDKIELVKEKRNEILKEYKKFREEYSKNCKKEKEEFLDYKEDNLKEEDSELLLSIVVPVYNTENYLRSCLNSIIKSLPNKLKNKCEVLIINDGSTDNSEAIIKEYENKYKYIKYISQKNKGLGNVRNVALKNVKGKYIASIDSDDTINKKFFKEVFKAINKNVDVFICDWLTKTNDGKYETAAIEYGVFDNISKYEGILYSSIMPSTCNKVIKKQLFDELKINYIEDKYEDFSTNPFILLSAKSIYYLNKPYYEYYIRSNSIMRSSAGLSMINVLKEFNNRLNKYKSYCKIDLEKFKYYTMSWRMEQYVFNQLYDVSNKEKEDIIKYLYNNLYDEVIEMFDNKYYKEMLNKLSKEKKEFILERNKAFKEKKLASLKMDKDCFRLTAPIIYFGDK